MKIEAKTAGLRADAFLAEEVESLTRNAVQKLMENGHILCNGVPVHKNYKTAIGDVFEVNLPAAVEVDIMPQDIPLDIVYEDDDLIVVNKPKGMVVHPAAGHTSGTLVNALLFHCNGSLSGINGELRPGIVHRLDKDTSGLLVAAKNDNTHQDLARQISEHTAGRIYEAVVRGNVRDDEGTIDAPIGRHPTDRKRMAVTNKNARYAITHYRVLDRYQGYCHIQCSLETGRTHQIRVHMASIGHPVLGDMVYGTKKPELGQSSQCLHARTLRLVHPGTGEKVEFSTMLPGYFTDVLTKLRKMR